MTTTTSGKRVVRGRRGRPPKVKVDASKSALEQLFSAVSSRFDEAIANAEPPPDIVKCREDVGHFIANYVYITDRNNPKKGWFLFDLWNAQKRVLEKYDEHDRVLVLKARQLGLSWLTLAYALHAMLFKEGSKVVAFSIGDTEAKELLSRVKEMYSRLPEWLNKGVKKSNAHEIELYNGSSFQSFPTTKAAGRSFTATIAIVDEAWFIQYFRELVNSVEPTIADGGKLIAISTADKAKPNHEFANMWRKGNAGVSDYCSIFLPWHARPNRQKTWYTRMRANMEQDDLWQEYPETPEQAMAARQADKRFALAWVQQCAGDAKVIERPKARIAAEYGGYVSVPPVNGLKVYWEPVDNHEYVIAADTSEGDVTSDRTPMIVFDADTWEEVAFLTGVFEPTVQANHLVALSKYYNDAVICVERNNHGHSVITTIGMLGERDRLYRNPFDKKFGWLSSVRYKPQAVNQAAEVLRDGAMTINSDTVRIELLDIESNSLKAPPGDTDDEAMALIIGVAALTWPSLVRRKRTRRRSSSVGRY